MILPISWNIYRHKKGFVFLLTFSIIMFLIISYFKTNMYPEHMNCFAIKNVDIKSKEIISGAEIKMNNFFKKYTKSRSSSHIKGWIEIAENVFIYSVYIDRCPSTMSSSSLCVQFVGIAVMNITDSDSSVSDLKCALKERSNVKKLGFAFIEKLPEHHFKPYTAIFVYCAIEDSMIDLTLNYFATLYKFSISTWLPTYYLVPKVSSNLAVNLCVRPLYGSFSSISVIEFLAFYKTMGVQHFVFYRFNISESTNLFFEYLKSTNLSIEINPWDMPLDDNLIHEYGQIVFTQDCIVQSLLPLLFSQLLTNIIVQSERAKEEYHFIYSKEVGECLRIITSIPFGVQNVKY